MPILHLTHKDNLPVIVKLGKLLPYSVLTARSTIPVDIARSDIRDARARTPVLAFPGRVLTDFVPFYLAPRSPMLLSLAQRAVVQAPDLAHRATYGGGQRSLVYLVSTLELVTLAGLDWCAYDGHPTDPLSVNLKNGADALTAFDGRVIRGRQFHNTLRDGDRKRRRSAEVLVAPCLPMQLITEVAVSSADVQREVEPALATCAATIRIRPQWYFAEKEVASAVVGNYRAGECKIADRALCLADPIAGVCVLTAYSFFEPSTVVHCADLDRLSSLITFSGEVLGILSTTESSRVGTRQVKSEAHCTVSVDLIAKLVHPAMKHLSDQRELNSLLETVRALVQPFAGSPHALRLLATLVARQDEEQWLNAARSAVGRRHREVVARHFARWRTLHLSS